jgi:hypothetical protein
MKETFYGILGIVALIIILAMLMYAIVKMALFVLILLCIGIPLHIIFRDFD